MKNFNRKQVATTLGAIICIVAAALLATSSYMLHYSVGYPSTERHTADWWKARLKGECPWTAQWMDSVYDHHCVKDTFVMMPSGYKGHALFIPSPDKGASHTAVIVHGYKVRAEGMLHIAYLYHHTLGFNVLLPDLYGHGENEGDHIQMGWNDRWDVIRWSEVAHELFPHTSQVIHGISMGAATVMGVSGEHTQDYVKCFVEDCGYTSVWDEFAAQLNEQFGLPAFPLMNATSALCQWRYGWSFAEASPISQVRKSTKPMLFIHGDKDTFVPYSMLRPLYEAKPRGRKAIFIAAGSEHAKAYRDHHEEYTRKVKDFVVENQ